MQVNPAVVVPATVAPWSIWGDHGLSGCLGIKALTLYSCQGSEMDPTFHYTSRVCANHLFVPAVRRYDEVRLKRQDPGMLVMLYKRT